MIISNVWIRHFGTHSDLVLVCGTHIRVRTLAENCPLLCGNKMPPRVKPHFRQRRFLPSLLMQFCALLFFHTRLASTDSYKVTHFYKYCFSIKLIDKLSGFIIFPTPKSWVKSSCYKNYFDVFQLAFYEQVLVFTRLILSSILCSFPAGDWVQCPSFSEWSN